MTHPFYSLYRQQTVHLRKRIYYPTNIYAAADIYIGVHLTLFVVVQSNAANIIFFFFNMNNPPIKLFFS